MKKRLALISFIIFAIFSFSYRQTTESKQFDPSHEKSQTISEIKPQSVKAVAFGVSEKVSSFAPASPDEGSTSKKMGRAEEKARAVPNKEPFRKQVEGAVHDSDSAQANFPTRRCPYPLSHSTAYRTTIMPPLTAFAPFRPTRTAMSDRIITFNQSTF